MARIFEPFFTTKEMGKARDWDWPRSTVLSSKRRRLLRLQRTRPGHDIQDLPFPVREGGFRKSAGAGADSAGTETILVAEDEEGRAYTDSPGAASAGYKVLGVDGESGCWRSPRDSWTRFTCSLPMSSCRISAGRSWPTG